MSIYTSLKAKPVGAWNDDFDRQKLADGFGRVLLAQPTEGLPVVAGVFAPWGAGKTHFTRLVIDVIKSEQVNTKVLWFEPWRYQSRQDVAAALLLKLMRTIQTESPDDALTTRVENTVKLIGRVFASGVGQAVERHSGVPINDYASELASIWKDTDPDYQSETDDMIAALGGLIKDWKGENRAFVVIDDLDRCLPEQMIRMMEALHVFLAESQVTFIVAIDRLALESAINQRYNGRLADVGRNYIDKIVHLPFALPPLGPKGIEAKYGGHLNRLNVLGQRRTLLNIVLGDNPRQVERFVNHFELALGMAKASGVIKRNDLDVDALVLLSLLRIRFPAFCDAWDRRPASGLTVFAREVKSGSSDWRSTLTSADLSELIPFGEDGQPLRALIRSLDEGWWTFLATYQDFGRVRAFAT